MKLAQTSLLIVVMAGEIALGGGLLIVCVVSPVVFVVLVDVDCVMIGSDCV